MHTTIEARGRRMSQLYRLTGESLAREIVRQSRPRRWFWQSKTVRDLIDERRSELAELAAERSAELAQVAEEYRARLSAEMERQRRPRRWPWQQKTIRDQVDERAARLMDLAAAQSERLATESRARRDELLGELDRQLKPRRWPWQQKTIRDQAVEQGLALRSAAVERGQALRDQAVGQGLALRSAAEERAQATRETAEERLSQARDAIGATVETARSAAGSAGDRAQALASDLAGATSRRGAQIGVATLLVGLAAGAGVAFVRGMRQEEAAARDRAQGYPSGR